MMTPWLFFPAPHQPEEPGQQKRSKDLHDPAAEYRPALFVESFVGGVQLRPKRLLEVLRRLHTDLRFQFLPDGPTRRRPLQRLRGGHDHRVCERRRYAVEGGIENDGARGLIQCGDRVNVVGDSDRLLGIQGHGRRELEIASGCHGRQWREQNVLGYDRTGCRSGGKRDSGREGEQDAHVSL